MRSEGAWEVRSEGREKGEGKRERGKGKRGKGKRGKEKREKGEAAQAGA
jgi:hypothetical protein